MVGDWWVNEFESDKLLSSKNDFERNFVDCHNFFSIAQFIS